MLFLVLSELGEGIMRYLNGARRIETEQEIEYLKPLVSEIYYKYEKELDLNYIDICIVDKADPNAFALGRHTVAVTKGAIATFTEDELKGIIAHELSHLGNRDTLALMLMFVGSGFFSVFMILINWFIRLLEISADTKDFKKDKTGFVIISSWLKRLFGLIFSAFGLIMIICQSFESRRNEFRADECSLYMGYGENLKDALYKLQSMNINDIQNPLEKMTASHHRTSLRIRELEQIMKYGYSLRKVPWKDYCKRAYKKICKYKDSRIGKYYRENDVEEAIISEISYLRRGRRPRY